MKEIELTQGYRALIDDEDFERVNQHSWFASVESRGTKIYAKRRRKKSDGPRWTAKHIRLGHFILDKTPVEIHPNIIDHSDDDGLNYQKDNLEIMTQERNMAKVKTWKRNEPCL